jgi:hypothetical protein
MPIIGRHHVHPYSNAVLFHDHRRDLHWDADHTYHFRERATVLLINIYRTPVSGVLRRKDSGFAVCGENLASVSQFAAGIRDGRSFKQEHDRARRVVGVGREGYWSGPERVTKMAEWPDWNPPEKMIVRQPYLPRFMAGGETNPLGARALSSMSGRPGVIFCTLVRNQHHRLGLIS